MDYGLDCLRVGRLQLNGLIVFVIVDILVVVTLNAILGHLVGEFGNLQFVVLGLVKQVRHLVVAFKAFTGFVEMLVSVGFSFFRP